MAFDVRVDTPLDASQSGVAVNRDVDPVEREASAARPLIERRADNHEKVATSSIPQLAEPGAASPQVAAASRSSAVDGNLRSNYQAALFSHVMQHRYYPEAARPARLHGTVRVHFELARNGRILAAWIEKSSGYAVIDDAALDALRRAEPLPPIPPEFPDEMEVLLPLEYLAPRVIRAG